VIAVVVVFAFSFVLSGAFGLILNKTVRGGMRVSEEEEDEGLDITEHREVAYALERV
jgi:ammonia channel protein AmtB